MENIGTVAEVATNGKESWNGLALAAAAGQDEGNASPREEGDGASSTSSSVDESAREKNQNDEELELFSRQRDEKLFEELLRLKLTSVPSSLSGPATSGVSTASLPPKQRIKLYQPRTKLEQFEDILLESQLLEATLPEFEDAVGLVGSDLDLLDGFDFEASDAIFSETSKEKDNEPNLDDPSKAASSSSSSTCDCMSCRERHDIEAKEEDELETLRKCWLEVREDIWKVYHLVLCNAWNDPNRSEEKPDLGALKEKVSRLVWRDPHQLFLRLEAVVREFVLEIKLRLIELLQKQAKNPSLAQDFIQYLLEGYEKLCSAAQHVTPPLLDLEIEHLRRFSLTWEVLNKHLYQSIIYTDPLIENNLPIFLSQLRSLYPDKEHEARYTELVRGYLDFDVEMVNIAAFWKTSEVMIGEYNQQQNLLRAKQKMLKEDWEKFKAQRKELEKQLKGKDQYLGAGLDPCECDVCNTPGIPPLSSKTTLPSSSSPVTIACNSGETKKLVCDNDLSKLYPHLYHTIVQGKGSGGVNSSRLRENQSLTSLFPSLLSVDGPKVTATSSVAAELSQALSTALSLSDRVTGVTTSEAIISEETKDTKSSEPISHSKELEAPPVTTASTNTTTTMTRSSSDNISTCRQSNAKTTNAEINKLLQQHYCSHKAKNLPSASAIRKGKVPPPTKCLSVAGDGDSTDELSEDSSSLALDDGCSSASSMTSHGGSSGKPCSCCYCEVFGHSSASGNAQPIAPVSRNYPEMRERLRLLLSKKKKMEQIRCKTQSHVVKSSASSVSLSSNSSVKSISNSRSLSASVQTSSPLVSKTSTITTNSSKPLAKVEVPESAVKYSKDAKATPQPQARSRSATTLADSTASQRKLEKSSSAVAPKSSGGKDIDSLLEFIEGSRSANEKKRAKKERQKQQRLAEVRARELEEKRRREAEEAERKRKEEEEKQRQEMEAKMLKKQKKKAAQRAKKLAAKGIVAESPEPEEKPARAEDKMLNLEELRLRQLRELQDLQAKHQKQFEEEQRRWMEAIAVNRNGDVESMDKPEEKASKRAVKRAAKKASKKQHKETSGGTSAQDILSAVAKSGPGTQIKISRTPSGGVEFTTIPANNTERRHFNEMPFSSSAPLMPNLMFSQDSPAFEHQVVPQQQSFSSSQHQKPSVTSKSSPSQPMVTIRRIETPDSSEPTVTISTQGEKTKDGKLLYTLINGQIHRAKDAPPNLIPGAKPLPLDIRQRLASNTPPPPTRGLQSGAGPRPPLPIDSCGKLDLDRLELPPGISITKIDGKPPERKYFPSKPDADQTILNLPGTIPDTPVARSLPPTVDYSSMAGMPSGLSGPNVIVVDTSSLKTREEEREEVERKKINKKKKKKDGGEQTNSQANGFQDLCPQIPPGQSNSLKSGPQVLIKNVNGKVVITPLPGPGAEGQKMTLNGSRESPPKIIRQDHGKSSRSSDSENIDEINSIFAPKDIDLENVDDDERVVEAFKRFCLDSVPLQQKAKVNFDVNNIAFKKK